MKSFNEAELIIKRAVDAGLIPGATYGILCEGQEYFGNYGYKQLEPEKIENNVDTLYDMASCSKVVATTTLIMKLIEQGKLGLNTKVKDILDDFPFEEITVCMLLTHTSGMVGDDKAYKKCIDRTDMYEFIKKLPLQNKPGETVEYSDFGYIILGFIIDKLTGGIEEFAKKIIFEPLGMNNTMYNPYLKGRRADCACTEITEQRGLIQGVVHDGKAYCLNGLSGNAGVFSCVKDLVKFARMILNEGAPVLTVDSINCFKKCYTANLNLHRTLGWCTACDEYACGKMYSNCAIFHTGFSGTSIYIDFVRNCAIILLTNRVHPIRGDVKNISAIRNAFSDAVLTEIDK